MQLSPTLNVVVIVLILLAVGLFGNALLRGGKVLGGLWDKRRQDDDTKP